MMKAPYQKRRGVAAVLVVITIGIFVVLAAFSLDISYMKLSQMQLRAATDAAAKAGAEALAREDSPAEARKAAKEVAALNQVSGSPLTLTDADIEFGKSVRNNDGTWKFNAGARPFSAVRVAGHMPVALFFGGITERTSFNPTVSATGAFAENEICLVVDRSHSMCFDLTGIDWSYPPGTPMYPHPIAYAPHPVKSRWAYLTQAIEEFVKVVDKRNNEQRVALVSFGSDIGKNTYEYRVTGKTFPAVFTDVPLSTDLKPINKLIHGRGQNVMAGGTNISAGIDRAVSLLQASRAHSYAQQIIIVMTDGKWNTGQDPVISSENARANGMTVHTVTFLDRADQQDMIDVATKGGGTHYHASNGDALVEAFRELASNLPVTLTE